MSDMDKTSTYLSNAIRDGSFPDSDEILSSELSSSMIPQLLNDISQSNQELNSDVSEASKSLGGGIDEWIAKARRVQEDIAKCKEDARIIVEEHARVQAQQNDVKELHQKSGMLSAEINFTTSLQDQLQSIASISQTLGEIEQLLGNEQAAQAARLLKDSRGPIAKLRGPQVRAIVHEYEAELSERTKRKLEEALYNGIMVGRDPQLCYIQVQHLSPEQSLDQILAGFSDLHVLKESLHALATKLELVMLQPLRRKSRLRANKHSFQAGRFEVTLGSNDLAVSDFIKLTTEFWDFLRKQLPPQVVQSLTQTLLPKMIGTLITDWMTPAIPVEFHELGRLSELQQIASTFASYIETNQWPGAGELLEWIERAPRIWLSKRKTETLDAVRKAFTASRGSLQQVERTERQKPTTTIPEHASEPAKDEWNTSWDEDVQDDRATEEDASGWGFDDEEELPSPKRTRSNGIVAARRDEDSGDAWGWGDEDQEPSLSSNAKPQPAAKVNGLHGESEGSNDVVLTELYSITDIPDHLIGVIGRDIQDSLTLAEEQHPSLQGVAPPQGLLTLPTFALAMFRATAPTHYSSSSSLGNMNLYNDAQYLAEKLRSLNTPTDMPGMEQDCKIMEKFGRSAYAREMDIQRTILNDLLDGAQGFEGCTQPLYAREIENAVSSTVDRVRQVYQDWKSILSTSALLQSIGALVTSVISKIITDIEEMDEVSAPQSEKLTSLCTEIASLEDLFLAKPPSVDESDEESVPMTAVYVSNWLKFQYLINILDASLVDIKYLWIEGELSLEYHQEEIVELIEALFQESSHRRSAVAAIRGQRGSGIR